MFTQWFDFNRQRAEFKTAKTQLIGDPLRQASFKKKKGHTTKHNVLSKRQCPERQGLLA